MALNKVAVAKLGKFGKLTAGGHAKAANSIFGDNACHNVCSYEDSFKSLTMGDKSSMDIFSPQGKENVEREMKIIKNEDKPKPTTKSFEMNERAFLELQAELGAPTQRKTFCS